MRITTRSIALCIVVGSTFLSAAAYGQAPEPPNIATLPSAEFAPNSTSKNASNDSKTREASPIPTAYDFLPQASQGRGVQSASAQIGTTPYVPPAWGTPASPYVSPYGPPSGYGASQLDSKAAKLPPGSMTHDQAGRLIQGNMDGNWYDFCGPNVRPCYSHIYLSADDWFMHRNDATWKNLSQNANTGAILGRSRDPDFNLENVARVTVGKAFCDWTLEGSAIYKDDIDAHTDSSVPGLMNAIFFGLQPVGSDYRNANTMRYTINDQFHSYEANLYNTVDFFNWMVGVRYVEFNELLDVLSSANTGTSNADISTHNRMIGGQIGFRLKYEWELNAFEMNVKTGMYYNDANTGTTVRDANNTTIIRQLNTNGQNEAYLSELSFIYTYNPTMHFALRAGYQFMYINEIALAPDQIVPANNGIATGFEQNAKGDMFMHGPTLGAEVKW
ncbi:MAG: hypothetical protein C0483_09305 [Pirellula sp.]|nr:hypothetical protein [Pirellula sp.]